MEKLAYIISISLVIILSVASIADSASYTITNITNDPYLDADAPQINSKGHIVWQGHGSSSREIFLYNGTTTIQLTNNDTYDNLPQINDSDYVVWPNILFLEKRLFCLYISFLE